MVSALISKRGALRVVPLALVVALMATGCGDGETASAPPETTTTTTTIVSSPEPERLCEVDDEFGLIAAAGEARGGPPTADELREEIETARSLLDESIRVAPDEIRASIETVAAGRAQWFDYQESKGFDVAQMPDSETGPPIEENFISGETAAADVLWESWNVVNS